MRGSNRLTPIVVAASLLLAACGSPAPAAQPTAAPARPAATTAPVAAAKPTTVPAAAAKPAEAAKPATAASPATAAKPATAASPVSAAKPAAAGTVTSAAALAQSAATSYKPAPAELVEAAKREGKVRFSSALQPREVASLIAAFKAAYPGIEVEYARTGVGEDERILLAMQGGTYEYDVLSIQSETYSNFRDADAMVAYNWSQTFGTEPKIVHPANTVVATGNQVAGIAYNTNLVPADRVPKTWDSCADPFFNGKKLWDVRPSPLIANYALWGEQRTLEYARKVLPGAAFVRGNTQAYTMLAGGETSIYCAGNFGPFTRFKQGAPTAPIEMSFPEGPLLGQPALEWGVMKGSPNQNAGILLLGWMSTEGLQYLGETGRDSFFHPRSQLAQLAQRLNREVVVYDWSYWERGDEIQNLILKEWQFPSAIPSNPAPKPASKP